MANTNLHKAKKQKNDEFYTQLVDIENELRHYQQLFRGKVVYCNCDDPKVSNFFRYFFLNFAFLGLKKLITTCYKNQDAELFSQHRSERAVGLICAERERERERRIVTLVNRTLKSSSCKGMGISVVKSVLSC